MIPIQQNLVITVNEKKQVGIIDANQKLVTFDCHKSDSKSFKPLTLCPWNDEIAICGGDSSQISVISVN